MRAVVICWVKKSMTHFLLIYSFGETPSLKNGFGMSVSSWYVLWHLSSAQFSTAQTREQILIKSSKFFMFWPHPETLFYFFRLLKCCHKNNKYIITMLSPSNITLKYAYMQSLRNPLKYLLVAVYQKRLTRPKM